MRLTLLLAIPVLLAISACTPNRDLTTASPYWRGEYRGGYNNGDDSRGDYIPTVDLDHSDGGSYSGPDRASDDLNE